MPHVEVGQGPLALPKCSPQAHPPRQAALATNRVCCGPLRRRAPRNLISQDNFARGDKNNYSRDRKIPMQRSRIVLTPQLGRTPHSCPGVESVGQTDLHARLYRVHSRIRSFCLVSRRRQPLPPLARQSRGLAPPYFLKQNVPHGKL